MRRLTKDGRTQSITKWAKELGISSPTIYRRLDRGDTDERALRPVREKLDKPDAYDEIIRIYLDAQTTPSIRQVADEMEMPVSTIGDRIQEMVKKGLLKKGSGSHKNLYVPQEGDNNGPQQA